MTSFGSHPDRTGRDMFAEAGLAALEDAGVPAADVDELFYGNFVGTLSEGQGHQGPLMAEALGTTAPSRRIESACASSGLAVRDAVRAIRSGEADVVVAGGMERMTNIHDNALVNDHAHLQQEITVEEALGAPEIASPFTLYDSCPISDGAAALVLASPEYADEHGLEASVAITGAGHGGDTMALHDRQSLSTTPATREAAEEAYDDADIEPSDVAIAEVHDCFTIAEVLALEALGLYSHGEAIGAARRGETQRDGELPVNLSGGLKAKGHPVGATGAAQVAAIATLLDGTHPRADAVDDDATIGVAQNAGGTVASATVHVLEVIA